MTTTTAAHIVDRLSDLGARWPRSRKRMIDEVHRLIDDDYIPGGGRASEATNLRAAPAGHRCGVPIGNDVQSGPFYCGEPATLMADASLGCIVCACKAHEDNLERLCQATATKPDAKEKTDG